MDSSDGDSADLLLAIQLSRELMAESESIPSTSPSEEEGRMPVLPDLAAFAPRSVVEDPKDVGEYLGSVIEILKSEDAFQHLDTSLGSTLQNLMHIIQDCTSSLASLSKEAAAFLIQISTLTYCSLANRSPPLERIEADFVTQFLSSVAQFCVDLVKEASEGGLPKFSTHDRVSLRKQALALLQQLCLVEHFPESSVVANMRMDISGVTVPNLGVPIRVEPQTQGTSPQAAGSSELVISDLLNILPSVATVTEDDAEDSRSILVQINEANLTALSGQCSLLKSSCKILETDDSKKLDSTDGDLQFVRAVIRFVPKLTPDCSGTFVRICCSLVVHLAHVLLRQPADLDTELLKEATSLCALIDTSGVVALNIRAWLLTRLMPILSASRSPSLVPGLVSFVMELFESIRSCSMSPLSDVKASQKVQIDLVINGIDFGLAKDRRILLSTISAQTGFFGVLFEIMATYVDGLCAPSAPPSLVTPRPRKGEGTAKVKEKSKKKRKRMQKKAIDDSDDGVLLPLNSLFRSTEATEVLTDSNVATKILEYLTQVLESQDLSWLEWTEPLSKKLAAVAAITSGKERNESFVGKLRAFEHRLVVRHALLSVEDLRSLLAACCVLSFPLKGASEAVYLATITILKIGSLGDTSVYQSSLHTLLGALVLHIEDEAVQNALSPPMFTFACLLYYLNPVSVRQAVLSQLAEAIKSHLVSTSAPVGTATLTSLVQLLTFMARSIAGVDSITIMELKQSLMHVSSACLKSVSSTPFCSVAKSCILGDPSVTESSLATFHKLLAVSCLPEMAAPFVRMVLDLLEGLGECDAADGDIFSDLRVLFSLKRHAQNLHAHPKKTAQSLSNIAVRLSCDVATAPWPGIHLAMEVAFNLLTASFSKVGRDSDYEGLYHSIVTVASVYSDLVRRERHAELSNATPVYLGLIDTLMIGEIPRHVFRTSMEIVGSKFDVSLMLAWGNSVNLVENNDLLAIVDCIVEEHSAASVLISIKRAHRQLLDCLASLSKVSVIPTNMKKDLVGLAQSLLHDISFQYVSQPAKLVLDTICTSKSDLSARLDAARVGALGRLLEVLSVSELPNLRSRSRKLKAFEAVICHAVKTLHELMTTPPERLSAMAEMLCDLSASYPAVHLFLLLIDNDVEKINFAILKLICFWAKPSAAESPLQALKSAALKQLSTVEHDQISKWIQQRLMGLSSGMTAEQQGLAAQFLLNLPSGDSLSHLLTRLQLDLLPSSILLWSEASPVALSVLKSMCGKHGMVGNLLKSISSIVASFEIDNSRSVSLGGLAELLKCVSEVLSAVRPSSSDIKFSGEADSSAAPILPGGEQLCTYTITEDTFKSQHWYYCYTCQLTYTEGVCSVCARVCHAGHDLSYSRFSRFFCDCGAGAKGMKCSALKPGTTSSFDLPTVDFELPSGSWLPATFSASNVLGCNNLALELVGLFDRLISLQRTVAESCLGSCGMISTSEKVTTVTTDLFRPQKAAKTSLKVKLDSEQLEHSELCAALISGKLCRNSLASNSEGLLAVAGPIAIDFGGSDALLGPSPKFSSKFTIPTSFVPLCMKFNLENPSFLAIGGFSQCEVATIGGGGVIDRLPVELGLDAAEQPVSILSIDWVPRSQVLLAVSTNRFIKIFDLSVDAICPLHYFTLVEDCVAATTMLYRGNCVILITLGTSGRLYVERLGITDTGPRTMTSVLATSLPSFADKAGSSIYYSSDSDLIFVSFLDGTGFAGRLSVDGMRFDGMFALSGSKYAFDCCVDVKGMPGAIVSIGKGQSATIGFELRSEEILVQALRSSSGSSILGICSAPKRSGSIFVLLDDGSISRFDVDRASNVVKSAIAIAGKQRSFASKARRSASSNAIGKDALPTFPITFFEDKECVTSSIVLGEDVLMCYTSEEAKKQLEKNDGYILCPGQETFNIGISIPDVSKVIVGLRVLVGNAAMPHIPRKLAVQNREIQLKEDYRRWYEIPFSDEETLDAGRSVTLTAVGSFKEGKEPLIDSLEVYALTKKAFDWAVKLENRRLKRSLSCAGSSLEECVAECCSALGALARLSSSLCSELSRSLVSRRCLASFLTEPSLRNLESSFEGLLSDLSSSGSEFVATKDLSQLSFVGRSLSTGGLRPEEFERIAEVAGAVAASRPSNFFGFLDGFPNAAVQFVDCFCLLDAPQVWEGAVKLGKHLAEFLHGCISHAFLAPGCDASCIKPSVTLLLRVLRCRDTLIRQTAAKVFISLLSGKADCMDYDGSVEESGLLRYTCDSCGETMDSLGARWHCDVCPDFDLCGKCKITLSKSIGTHEVGHSLTQAGATSDAASSLVEDVEMLEVTSMSTDEREALASAPLPELLLEVFLEAAPSFCDNGASFISFGALLFHLYRDVALRQSHVKRLVSAVFPGRRVSNSCSIATSLKEVALLGLKFLDALLIEPRNGEKSRNFDFLCKILLEEDLIEDLKQLFENLHAHLSVTKSPSVSEGCLLTPSGTTSADSLYPFFSKVFIKSKPTVFTDIEMQLLQAASRLAFHLKPGVCEGTFSEEAWVPLLCNLQCLEAEGSVSFKYGKKLLKSICGSRLNYLQVRDSYRLNAHATKLRSLWESSGEFRLDQSYSDVVRLMSELTAIAKIASDRPRNWQSFVSGNVEFALLLVRSSFFFEVQPASLVLELIALAFMPEDEIDLVSEEKDDIDIVMSGDGDSLVSSFGQAFLDEENLLVRFINVFLLEFNSSSARCDALKSLKWLYQLLPSSGKEIVFELLIAQVRNLPAYGKNASEFMLLLSEVVLDRAETVDPDDAEDVFGEVFLSLQSALKSQNLLLSNHPNSHVYQMLSCLLDFEGYYLESQPCLVCNDPDVPFSDSSLSSLKVEAKFTEDSQLAKLNCSLSVKRIVIAISDIHQSRMVKTVDLYCNNKPVDDITELKGKWDVWKKMKTCTLKRGQEKVSIDFPIPITMTNFMVKYSDFYVSPSAASERLQCPRCTRTVHDKNGICKHCHENAHQCRLCRNINYENLYAFQCNECGFSRYGQFAFTLLAQPSFASERIENDEDRDHGMDVINEESSNAHRRYEQVLSFKRHIMTVISSINTEAVDSDVIDRLASAVAPSLEAKVNKKVAILANLYGVECKRAFDSLSKSSRKLLATRREVVRYNCKKNVKVAADAKQRPPNSCFGCANSFVSLYLNFVESVAFRERLRRVFVSQGIIQELVASNLQGAQNQRSAARHVIALLIEDDMSASGILTDLLKEKLRFCLENHRSLDLASCIRNEVQLIMEIGQIDDTCWEHRFKLIFDLFFFALKLACSNPVMSEQVILPCLRFLKSMVVAESDFVSSPAGKPTVSYDEWKDKRKPFSAWRASFEDILLCGSSKEVALLPRVRAAANRWRIAAGLPPVPCLVSQTTCEVKSLGWMSELLFSKCSRPVRCQVAGLLESMCCSPSRSRSIVIALYGLLGRASDAGDSSSEFFCLLEKLLLSASNRVLLARKGLLQRITELISQEVCRIQAQEDTFTSDISQGFVLRTYIDILSSFLEMAGMRRIFKSKQLTVSLLDSFLSLRGVLVQKTKLTEDSSSALLDLLKSLHADNAEDNQLFITACVKALDKHDHGREPIFIFEQLCNIVCPEKPVQQYHVNLTKSTTQEEFIRGSMTKNPYLISDIGTTMKDIKEKICRDMDLYADLHMELLVADKIINLDLPIDKVFEQVWLKDPAYDGLESCDAPPMDIVYRIQGLDGEATEEIVETVSEDDEEDLDPEVEFAVAGIMESCGGLEAMVKQIEAISDFEEGRELALLVLRLLYHTLKLKVNRVKLVEMGSISVLLDKLMLVFPNESQVEIAELLLLTVESIVNEANDLSTDDFGGTLRRNRSFNELSFAADNVSEKQSQMLVFLSKLGSPLVRCNPRIVTSMTRIIPVLTYGMRAIEEALVNFFVPHLDLIEFDGEAFEDETHHFHLKCFAAVAKSIQPDENGVQLKKVFLDLGVVPRLLEYVHKVLPKSITEPTDVWLTAVGARSLPYVLPALSGLVRGVPDAQKLALQNSLVIRLLHLSGLSTNSKIGNLAEALVDNLRFECGDVARFVEELEAARKSKKKQEAQKHRQRVLSAMGIKQQGGSLIPAHNELEETLDEEAGLACKVCKEGFTFLPTSVMGFYVYSKRVSLTSSRQDFAYSTVTNFNTIHLKCHKDAVRADANLKPRKEEWEGATLRNSSTLCNNIFPLRGEMTPEADYSGMVDRFFSVLSEECGRCESTRFRLLAHDLCMLLSRFAEQESFSHESRGGSKESNIMSVPFFVQLGTYLLNQTAGAQRALHQQILSQFLAQVKSPVKFWVGASTHADNPLYIIASTLFLLSLEEWKAWKPYLLKRAIVHALATVEKPQEDSQDDGDVEMAEVDNSSSSFHHVKPALLFMVLVDQLQTVLKKSSGTAVSTEDTVVAHMTHAKWIEDVDAAIAKDGKAVAESCREIVEEFEEFGRFSYESLAEFVDDLEIADLPVADMLEQLHSDVQSARQR